MSATVVCATLWVTVVCENVAVKSNEDAVSDVDIASDAATPSIRLTKDSSAVDLKVSCSVTVKEEMSPLNVI